MCKPYSFGSIKEAGTLFSYLKKIGESLESWPNDTKRETFQGESLETDSQLVSPNSNSKFQESSELVQRFDEVILIQH